MKVLLLGTGAALHALVWKIVSEMAVEQVHCAPGNAGTTLLVGTPPFSPEHGAEIAQWAFAQQMDLIVVQGRPDWTEMLTGVGLPVVGVGPREHGALRSRQQVRDLLRAHGLPLVEGQSFGQVSQAERYLASRPLPLWLHLDNAAQRQAVRVGERFAAFQELARLDSLDSRAGVSIEEHVEGPEVLLTLLTDGRRAVSWGLSRPYDCRYEDEIGPLTEGMGAYGPYGDPDLERQLLEQVGRPAVAALAAAGCLRPAFVQLRIVLRAGGPVIRRLSWDLDSLHAAVTLPRWPGEIAGMLQAAALGHLSETAVDWQPGVAVAVAMAVEGYPESTGGPHLLSGLFEAPALVLQDNTRLAARAPQGPLPTWLRPDVPDSDELVQIWTTGRALLVVGCAPEGVAARRQAYGVVQRIQGEHLCWRQDIAAELVDTYPE